MAGPRPGYQGIQPGYRQGLLGAGYAACLRESLRPQTSLRPHRPPPRRRRLLLRRPLPRRRRTRLARRTQPRSHVRRRLALAVQQPQRLPLSLLCTGRTSFAPGAGAPTVRRWDWFCCRSTAPGANRADTNLRPVQPPPFAPGAGAPTVRRWDWLCCRSTASVRTGRAQSTPHACPHSHPGRVLLRGGGGIGFFVGAPPRCERGRAQTLLTHTSPCTTSQPHHPLLYSCPDNPLDISKSPIQEAQCRVTSNLPIPPSASWTCVRGGQAVPHNRRYPGTRTGFLRSEQRSGSGQYLAYGGAAERCPDLVLCRDAGSFPLVDAVE